MKHIAAHILQRFHTVPHFQRHVLDSAEPYRALVWASGVFTQEFLHVELDPIAPKERTPEMEKVWTELMDCLDGKL